MASTSRNAGRSNTLVRIVSEHIDTEWNGVAFTVQLISKSGPLDRCNFGTEFSSAGEGKARLVESVCYLERLMIFMQIDI